VKILRLPLTLIVGTFAAWTSLVGQSKTTYSGTDATGLLTLSATVDVMQQAQGPQLQGAIRALSLNGSPRLFASQTQEFPKNLPKRLRPAISQPKSSSPLGAIHPLALAAVHPLAAVAMQFLSTALESANTQFNGLTHLDQRNANNGNQFSVEPPSPNIAVANGFVLEGVNNAIQIYDTSGNPLLPQAISTNQLFGLPPAIDRNTGANGPYPTDMRVFFDSDIQRWIVLQRSQDNDIECNALNSSHLFLAVSQSDDPTGTYNVYTANTTDASNASCPCLLDYPQIGADQYGFYISANEFNTSSQVFVDDVILAISKVSLASGASTPSISRFLVPFTTGYEFATQPATTPPGASYFLADGGVEYFASTAGNTDAGDQVSIWAMSNTSSLATNQPNLKLEQVLVPTLSYSTPPNATQLNGSRPYGASLVPTGPLPLIDGGDIRALSLSYAGGRLYLTFSTAAMDQNGNNQVGGAYVIFSPTIRGSLAATVLSQGVLVVDNSDFLRPSIAVNEKGQGAITGTVTGPEHYPSAVFVPFDRSAPPSMVKMAAKGDLPEDGFTGYTGGLLAGIARWGDYSTAVVASDGSVWLATEYIGDLPRSEVANWDTFIMKMVP